MKPATIDPSKKEAPHSSALASSPPGARKSSRGNIRYRALLEAAPDAIVVVNQAGAIVLVNAQAEALFGYRRDELIGRHADILVSEHFRVQHGEQHARFLSAIPERPMAAGLELFGMRKDGTEFPAEIRLSPLDTKQGILVSSAIRDISARRKTEEDLRQLASIVAGSDDAIFGKTLEGIITSWNASAERIYGYSAAEAIGKPASLLIPASHKDEIPQMLEGLKRGETVDHFETVWLRKDGREIHVELTVSPIRDALERIVGSSTIGRDISVRKQRENDLSRLAAVVESSDDAIIGTSLDGTITTWNGGARRIYGYSAAEVVGKSMSILFPPDRVSEVMETIERIKIGERVEKADSVRVAQDGKEVHVALVHAPIRNAQGQVVGVSTVARDITESMHLEEMFRQAQRMEAVGQLAGGVAHDFNNLLGVILGYTGLLLERMNPEDPHRRDIEQIQKAGDRAALLTRQLLTFSRKQVIQPKVLDLNAVVTGAEELLRRLIGEDIDLRVVLGPALAQVRADSGQIEQIVMNLAVNARDAMPTGGKLTIETSNVEFDEEYASRHASTLRGPHVMLAVTDTGCGMDEKTKARIFEPFFTTKELGKGTGLGLSTVYGVVKQSDGYVWVYSEPGVGTTFKIYLPCVGRAPEIAPPRDVVDRVERGSQTILIVEDDAALLQVTRRSLEAAGYAILTAGNAPQAINISKAHSGPIDLVVTDVIMPQMNGAELGSRLSSLRPEMKVLYVSGYTDNAIVHQGVLEAGLAFLQKPFSPKTLARKVREVLATALPAAEPAIHEK